MTQGSYTSDNLAGRSDPGGERKGILETPAATEQGAPPDALYTSNKPENPTRSFLFSLLEGEPAHEADVRLAIEEYERFQRVVAWYWNNHGPYPTSVDRG